MATPRVLIVLDTAASWSRGILRGFAQLAHQQGWTLFHYHPSADLGWIVSEFRPHAAVLGPAHAGPWPRALSGCLSVAVNVDRSAEGIASVCLDEQRIAELALSHFLERGVRNLTTFRFNADSFAVQREAHFTAAAARAGARLVRGWWAHARAPSAEDPLEIVGWLRSLERPCGIFACCDSWAQLVARYARATNLRFPEDAALVGVDDDLVQCEIVAPALSSVAIPWLTVGTSAARLVHAGLRGQTIAGARVVIEPLNVVVRRSSDTLAVSDPLVAAAVSWIQAHADRRLSVPMVAQAVGSTRQRLERHFRRALGRTILQEIRRAHVELARRLLATTNLPIAEVAKQSGFTNAALLTIAFSREVGMPPGAYRRHALGLAGSDE